MFKTGILASAALMIAGTAALASAPVLPGFGIHAVPMHNSHAPLFPVTPNLYPLSAQFVLLPSNYNGTDQWPCYGGGTECSSIDQNGVVVGIPIYTWSLSACDNSSAPATPCGQIYFFYQDQTNDSTDDLTVTVTVKQGTNYIFAVGPKDIGPNPYPNETVVFSGDKAFGTQGQTGKGNGWCAGSKHTCVDPVTGVANGEATIQVGPYVMREKFSFYLQ